MSVYIGVALLFNLIDFVTGFLSAVKSKNIQSNKLRDGLFKKVGFVTVYALAWVFDTCSYYIGVTLTVKVLPVIVAYACITETVSILENACKMNPDLSKSKLMEFFNLDGGNENEGH